ncbi:DUF2164 domain-containing protein [Thalassotalea sp. M1531]|uniref:DUF2164 domain-containing protein n=1 Tax=Thalassotalea algicola TaxID=2716224 RepID=A0A7Y0LCZ4_9GAMM|nr:DUF2164 domain-containing protein [Thalassotalea algicola]NMP32156.1 DUF2164 domain-containing protein [Thalassotalea algicola]
MNSLSKEQKNYLTGLLADYLNDELSIEIGEFDAEFFCDFIVEKLGPHFYNQGLADAQAVLMKQMDNITYAIDEVILPTEFD